jgi:hypothetical protein
MVLWLGFEYGFTRSRRILGFFMFGFGMVEIAIHAVSDAAQAVFVSAIPTFQAAIIPITVWIAGISILIAGVGDILKPRRLVGDKASFDYLSALFELLYSGPCPDLQLDIRPRNCCFCDFPGRHFWLS